MTTVLLNIRGVLIGAGYLYLAERLPQNHELGLMFINTIRKVSTHRT